VEDYSRGFLGLLTHCDNLAPRTVIDLYNGGLGQPLAHYVEMQHPADLQKVMSLARAFEQHQAKAPTVNNLVAPKGSGCRATTSATTTASGAMVHEGKAEGTRPVEMHEKRQSGQCYFCPEPYNKDYKCAAKGVFLWNCQTARMNPQRDHGLGDFPPDANWPRPR